MQTIRERRQARPHRPGRLAEADHTRGLPKRSWATIIILVPTLGGILYLLFGRAGDQVSQAARVRARRSHYGRVPEVCPNRHQQATIAASSNLRT